MELNFDFPIQNFRGEIIVYNATETMINILEQSIVQDEKLIDKIDAWGRKLSEERRINVDLVDAKDIKTLVIRAGGTFSVAKPKLKNYIQDQIEQEEKTNGQGKSQKAERSR